MWKLNASHLADYGIIVEAEIGPPDFNLPYDETDSRYPEMDMDGGGWAGSFPLGVPIIRAVTTYPDWPGWVFPLPSGIGLALVILTGAALSLTVVNLALRGFGAPFAIALSKKLAMDWLYAWTRNPMVLAGLAFLLSLGLWFRSALFVLWVLVLFSPALLFFVKVYEERELEIRFGASYLAYKSRTPMLFPRAPKG